MAQTTAVDQLQEQIDAIRREAFAQGYAAAMAAVRDLANKPALGAAPSAAAPRGRPSAAPRAPAAAAAATPARRGRPRGTTAPAARRTGRAAAAARPQRGTNARFVEEVLQSNAPRPLRPAEIRSAIQRDKGVAMAFTSIRHALGQLEARQAAEQVGDSKTWRYTGGGAD